VDEFLRVRFLLDAEQSEQGKEVLEASIVQRVSIQDFIEAEFASEDEAPDIWRKRRDAEINDDDQEDRS